MGADRNRIDKHWRRLPDDDAGWTKELRVRSHDIANWASRMEGMMVGLEQKIDQVGSAEQISEMVERKVKQAVVSSLSRAWKVAAAVIMVMQAVILYRSR